MMQEGNDSPVKIDNTTSSNPVVMSGAIGGSNGALPSNEKEDEEKHKQREKTALVNPLPRLL
jgi:serine/threonine-protein kinase SRPK3